MEETTQQKMQRFADRLVELGYAKSHLVSVSGGFGEFVWTPKGRTFYRNLREIFDVPNVHPRDVDHTDVISLVALVLFTGARSKA